MKMSVDSNAHADQIDYSGEERETKTVIICDLRKFLLLPRHITTTENEFYFFNQFSWKLPFRTTNRIRFSPNSLLSTFFFACK